MSKVGTGNLGRFWADLKLRTEGFLPLSICDFQGRLRALPGHAGPDASNVRCRRQHERCDGGRDICVPVAGRWGRSAGDAAWTSSLGIQRTNKRGALAAPLSVPPAR